MKESKKFLVIGHPRSGTGYMSKLFISIGYDVQHERMGRHGTSCWSFAIENDNWMPWFRSNRDNWDFDWVIHVVRNPVDVINSVYFTEEYGGSAMFRSHHLNLPPLSENYSVLERVVDSVLGWNELILSQNPDVTVRAETAQNQIRHFLQVNDIHSVVRYTDPPPRNVNSRSHKDLTLTDFKLWVPREKMLAIKEFTERYNYKTILDNYE